jgi:Glycosyl hydrolase family 1
MATTPPTSLKSYVPGGVELPVQSGDLETISTPIDLLGVNYYTSSVYSGVDEHGRTEDADGHAIERVVPRGLPTTAMGWEIFPQGLTDLLVGITRDYPGLPIVITESGAAFDDHPGRNRVRARRRSHRVPRDPTSPPSPLSTRRGHRSDSPLSMDAVLSVGATALVSGFGHRPAGAAAS